MREQGLGEVPYLSAEAFAKAVENVFDQPHMPILGGESAESAAQRMQRAIGRLRSVPAVVISHGRTISAYVGALLRLNGLNVRQTLKMPDVVLVDPAARGVRRIGSPFS